jgi:Fur family ferric uptake transcriptional regulator
VLHSFLGHDGVKCYARCTECTTHSHHDVHPHFQCTSCGKTECLSYDVSIPQLEDRQIESVQVLYSGKCDNCL